MQRSYRALTLAALDLVRLGATPVHELVQIVEVELDRHGELLGDALEVLRADAVDVLVEGLAFVALPLVVADPALHGLGDPLGGQARLEPLAVAGIAAAIP